MLALCDKANEAWPNDWFDFLETCRLKAQETRRENQPWVCTCGKAVGLGSPVDAAKRTGNSLWSHLLPNVGTEFHPGQDDIDRWEQQIPHSQNKAPHSQKNAKRKGRKWGGVEDVWPYIAELDRESLRELRRRIDVLVPDEYQKPHEYQKQAHKYQNEQHYQNEQYEKKYQTEWDSEWHSELDEWHREPYES